METFDRQVKLFLEVCFACYEHFIGHGASFEVHTYADWISVRIQRDKTIEKTDQRIIVLQGLRDNEVDDLAWKEMTRIMRRIDNPVPF